MSFFNNATRARMPIAARTAHEILNGHAFIGSDFGHRVNDDIKRIGIIANIGFQRQDIGQFGFKHGNFNRALRRKHIIIADRLNNGFGINGVQLLFQIGFILARGHHIKGNNAGMSDDFKAEVVITTRKPGLNSLLGF